MTDPGSGDSKFKYNNVFPSNFFFFQNSLRFSPLSNNTFSTFFTFTIIHMAMQLSLRIVIIKLAIQMFTFLEL